MLDITRGYFFNVQPYTDVVALFKWLQTDIKTEPWYFNSIIWAKNL